MPVLKRASYRRMPWKNGRGVTEEVAIHPPQSDFSVGNFHWRLSAATVENAGPFSEFPGCDRWLTVWKGPGITLNGVYLPPHTVRQFAGEIAMVGEPTGGAVTDLGLIVRREHVRSASMEVLRWNRGEATLPAAEGTCFLFCADGVVEVRCEGEDGADIVPSAAGCLEAGDCLRRENPAESKFRVVVDATLIFIRVES